MCSQEAIASRNVRQELQLAWRYERPILPLLLQPTVFPDDVVYWLEGAQWIEVLDKSPEVWLPAVHASLARFGLAVPVALPLEEASPSVAASELPPNNLPDAEGPLIGRQREVQLLALIDQGQLITNWPAGQQTPLQSTRPSEQEGGGGSGGIVSLEPTVRPGACSPAAVTVPSPASGAASGRTVPRRVARIARSFGNRSNRSSSMRCPCLSSSARVLQLVTERAGIVARRAPHPHGTLMVRASELERYADRSEGFIELLPDVGIAG